MSNPKEFERIGGEAYSILRQFFEIDRDLSLNGRVLDSEEFESCQREKVVFRGAQEMRVPAYCAFPKVNLPPYPCILLAHGVGDSKETWWQAGMVEGFLTRELLSAGFAVLSLDAPYHGERTFSLDYAPIYSYLQPNLYRQFLVQWTVEYRLAIEYLAQRAEIDSSRIGVIGYSLGGVMTFILSAVEPRIKAAVACVTLPIGRYYIEQLGWEATTLLQLKPIAPQTFAPAIQPPFLMLNGSTDMWGRQEEVQALYGMVGSNKKELVFFESGHQLPKEHVPRAVDWMQRYL